MKLTTILIIGVIVLFCSKYCLNYVRICIKGNFYNMFKKTLIKYLIGAFLIISVFTFAYFFIVAYDVNTFEKENKITAKQLSENDMLYEKMKDSMTIKGLPTRNYFSNPLYVLLDAFYFSSITFFTIGYGDVLVTGWYRILVIVESALGVGFTGFFISFIVMNYTTDKIDIASIKAKIYAGWKVLIVAKEKEKRGLFQKNITTVILISPNKEISRYVIEYDYDLVRFLKKHTFEWHFNNYNINSFKYLNLFLVSMREYLLFITHPLWSTLDLNLEINTYRDIIKFNKFLKKLNEFNMNENTLRFSDKYEFQVDFNISSYYLETIINRLEKTIIKNNRIRKRGYGRR